MADHVGKRQRPWRFDDEKVSFPNSGLRHERLLNVAIVEYCDRGVDFGVLPSKEGVAPRGRIRASQPPGVPAFGQHGLKAGPELCFVIHANLKSRLLQTRTEDVDVRLHPKGDERRSIDKRPLALPFAQKAPDGEVAHALGDGAKRNIGSVRHVAEGRVHQLGPDEESHDGL
ncbi:MAG TPA: hypothetical protein VF159_08640, partial [Gemmatimonadaceae bacterium]